MPSNLLTADTSFPRLTNEQSPNEKIEVMTNYLYMVLEQLRYTLANLGEENFNDTEFDGIVTKISEPFIVELKDTNSNITRLSATVNGLRLGVSNGTDSSTVSLLANGVAISSQKIQMTGVVTFSDLEGSGTTTINGAYIETGTIKGSVIEGSSFYSVLDANGNIGGDIKMCYKNKSYIVGGIRVDDQGDGTVDEGKYRMYIHCTSAVTDEGILPFCLKIYSTNNASFKSDENIYIKAQRIYLTGRVIANGVVISDTTAATSDATAMSE